MGEMYTQKRFVNGEWVPMYPETTAAQVIEDVQRRFVTDAEKAIFTGKQDNIGFVPEDAAKKGRPDGYAGLDADGRLPIDCVPSLLDHNKGYFTDAATLSTACPTANAGDFAILGTTDTVWIWDADNDPAAWVDSATKGSVISVNGKTGAVTIGWNDLTAPDASITSKGVVKLNSATNSTVETEAATPKAVKSVMDALASRTKISVGATAPENPADGELWVDTSNL